MPDYTARVDQVVEKFKGSTLGQIETTTAQKRITWFELHIAAARRTVLPSPRMAFNLLFFEYMRLDENDLEVIEETQDYIGWLSRNPCPTLDTCLALHLDTRQVCRLAYERSTQAFISKIDPRLRFIRSYQAIRPYADVCQESIQRVDFNAMMANAIQEAAGTPGKDDCGVGAIISLGSRILARSRAPIGAAAGMASVNAICQAIQACGEEGLTGAILFTTLEPDPSIIPWILQGNLTAIIYGASIADVVSPVESFTGSGAVNDLVFKGLIDVSGGVLREECLALYR